MMAHTAYVPTNWVDDVTPIDDDHLNNLEHGIVNLENDTIFYEELGTIDEQTGEITLNSNQATNNN